MNKNEEKRLCFNCDGSVGFELDQCPYCGTPLSPIIREKMSFMESEIPPPPYATKVATGVNEYESKETKEGTKKDEQEKRELFALLLLLPGIVFFLFGLALLFFSKDGVFTLKWNQNFAYFYFIGSIPLMWLGFKALR